MIGKLLPLGLAVDACYVSAHVKADFNGELYNSFVFPFNLAGAAPREISSRASYNASVDSSVVKRWDAIAAYRPKNLKHVIEQIKKTGNWP